MNSHFVESRVTIFFALSQLNGTLQSFEQVGGVIREEK